MKILELSFKNVLSYGNKLQTLKISDEPQLVLVEGENGSGKSTIKEALTVSLYGKSAIRKNKDIPNWINKNAFTEIKFLTSSGEKVEISRGIEPNFSEIKINGVSHNLPDKRRVDEFVEDELLKVPFTVFCNTISLSFDDFKSFINLSNSDKRKIIDRIFGIDILTDMRQVVKENLKEYRKSAEIISSQIDKNRHTLENSQAQLKKLQEKIEDRIVNESRDISNKIKEQDSLLLIKKEKFQEIKGQIDSLQKEVNLVRDQINLAKNNISNISEKLDIFNKNRCPHCFSDLTSDASLKIKETLLAKKEEFDKSIPELRLKFTELTASLNTEIDTQNLLKSEYYQIQALLNQLNQDLKRISNFQKSDESESILKIIDSIESEIEKDATLLLNENSNINLYLSLDDLLSDNGIKKELINKIIPTLNSRILEISKRLEFKFNLEFNNEFDPQISYLGLNISPESLSSGQRKKMNLIVLLSFIELIKMKHSSMNIMFLDEIFSSLDKNNVYMAIQILKEYSEKYGLTIFVVSHEALPEEFFSAKIKVSNKNHFSDIVIERTSVS
jgi:DNA repair exonuclease SbcCD ATPase subunit